MEIHADGTSVRRAGNKALPAQTGTTKKRDAKAESKAAAYGATNGNKEEEEKTHVVERDAEGRVVFCQQDFENTLIVHFKTTDIDEEKDADYKVNWKDLNTMVAKKFDQVKVVYSRADKYEGDVAVSSYRLNKAQYAAFSTLQDEEIGGKKFTFSETKGEELKDFWQKQGGHFQYCISAKLRFARKNQRKVQELKREERAKRQKQSFTIAGIYYTDINKVKSKSRAILNIKKDGEKLDKPDEEFMSEILKFHDRHGDKVKDFSHFEVGAHPEFTKTRCFFVVNKAGAKEDFSVSKCINNLEQKTNEAAAE